MDYKTENYPPEPPYSLTIDSKVCERLDVLVCEIKIHKCPLCGKPLEFDHVDMYNHEYGWYITEEIPKQWLSVHCDYCNYDISLNKLGVRR
jgi:hypothetical protein